VPNIIPRKQSDAVEISAPLSLDGLRDNPDRLVTLEELAELGLFNSYGTAQRWVREGKLPPPYRFRNRNTWEGRHVVTAIDRTRKAVA
jgi:hypothetical protein